MSSTANETSLQAERRISKLSVAALLAAGLTAPFVTLPFQFQAVWPLFVLPAVPLVLGILALLRIGRSQPRRRGQTFAMMAIVLAIVWLGSTIVVVSLGVQDGSRLPSWSTQ